MADIDAFSTNLSKSVEEIIGSRDGIQKRQRMFDILYSFDKKPKASINYIPTGSKTEGLVLEGSDIDKMVVFNCVNILDSEQSSSSQTVFMNAQMRYAPESQGTVFLDVHDIQRKSNFAVEDNLFESLVKFGDNTVISSTLFRDNYVSFLNSHLYQSDRGEINGPSFTLNNEPVDYAAAFHCSVWPKCAMEWSKRRRPFGWPPFALIKRIEEDGCYVVPNGENISANSDVLWRISFAPAETKLIRSLSDVQFKTYALLKIVLKENNNFRCVRDVEGPVLCSYFMKMIIFHVVENTPSSFWVEANLFRCFLFCLNVLINCVETGFCPHYFFLAKNLFRKRVFGTKRLALLQNLQIFRNKGIHCLDEHVSSNRSQIAKDIEWFSDRYMYQNCTKISNLEYNFDSLHLMFSLLAHLKHEHDAQILLLILYKMLTIGASGAFKAIDGLQNNEIYCKLRQSKNLMFFITQLNASCGWLSLATFYYMIGQYKNGLYACQAIRSLVSSSTLYHNDMINQNCFQGQRCGRNIPLHSMHANTYMELFHVTKDISHVALPELQPEVRLASPCFILIKPIFYAPFLSFFCHLNLGDGENAAVSLHDLRASLELQTERLTQQSTLECCTVYNMTGQCLQILGDNRMARQYYMKSMKIAPKFLATKCRLESLSLS